MIASRTLSLCNEFQHISLGDKRREQRAKLCLSKVAESPSAAFPKIFKSNSELKAFYRLMNNKHIDFLNIHEGHRQSTIQRASKNDTVLLLHDTTEVSYKGDVHREGLGRLRHGGQGFFAHLTLATSPFPSFQPLGVIHFQPWTRAFKEEDTSSLWPFREKEQERWMMAVENCRNAFTQTSAKLIHVMDREADDYSIFSPLSSQDDFVIRLKTNRCIQHIKAQQPEKVHERLKLEQVRFERDVRLARRAKGKTISQRKIHPARKERRATLSISAAQMDILRPSSSKHISEQKCTLNVVRVWEKEPPQDCRPVEWYLMTTLPVDTTKELEAIIDIYRHRWLIEEYIKALKTGCSLNKRRGENLNVLLKTTAMLLPVAWRALALRFASRNPGSAKGILNKIQLKILISQGFLKDKNNHGDVLVAVAQLGGYSH